jgi:hypothetical protein
MSQPSGSPDAQSSKRNVGGRAKIFTERHTKRAFDAMSCHENRISDYWTGRRSVKTQVSATLRVHGDWKSWRASSRFHCIWELIEACRSAIHAVTLSQSQTPGDRPLALEACFLQYVEPSSFLVPSFGSSAEPAPRMYWRASVTVLKRGVAVLRAAAARYDGTSSEKKDMPLHSTTRNNNVGLGRCRAPKMGCF